MSPEKIPFMAHANIKNIRKQRGLTQETLAEALGVSVSTYSRIENGQSKLTVDVQERLAAVLDVDVSEFHSDSPLAAGPDEEGRARRLRFARERRFETARDACDHFGWNYDTYANHESGRRTFRRLKAIEYAKAFNVAPNWLLLGKERSVRPPPMVQQIGEVAAGVWLEQHESDLASLAPDDEHYFPGDPDYPAEEQFAIVVRGNSMNEVANDGDTLICVKLSADIEIGDDDIAIVERTRGTTYERTAKRVVFNNGAIELWPESTDPRFQSKLDLDPNSEDSEVRLLGKVIRILKHPPPPRSRLRRG